jgi:hypothetical protein
MWQACLGFDVAKEEALEVGGIIRRGKVGGITRR